MADKQPSDYKLKLKAFKYLLIHNKNGDAAKQYNDLKGSLNGHQSTLRNDYYTDWSDEDMKTFLEDVHQYAEKQKIVHKLTEHDEQ